MHETGSRPDGGFTVQLALVDAVPVLEFCASMVVVALRLQSTLFIVGALCCILAGCGKVVWKLLLAVKGKGIPWLSADFMRRMLTGFALMVAALLLKAGSIDLSAVLARAATLPAAGFFAVAIACMAVLCVLRAKLDQRDSRSNWAEQFVNIAMQTALLVGVLVY